MFPTLTQRGFLIVGLALGLLSAWWVLPWVQTWDGSLGLSLSAGPRSPAEMWGLLGLALLPSLCIGVVLSSTGHVHSGPWLVSAVLMVISWRTGSVGDMLARVEIPDVFRAYLLESLAWSLSIILVVIGSERWGGRLRDRLPRWAIQGQREEMRLGALYGFRPWTAGLLTAGLAMPMIVMLARSPAKGQVLVVLIVAFAIAAFVGGLLVKHRHGLPVLLAPGVVSGLAYAMAAGRWAGADRAEYMLAWRSGAVSPLVYALPVDYCSAGVVGAGIGLGLSEAARRAGWGEP